MSLAYSSYWVLSEVHNNNKTLGRARYDITVLHYCYILVLVRFATSDLMSLLPALLVAGVQSKVLENSWLQTTADGGKQWPYFDTVAYHSDCCEINSIFCMSLLLLQTFQLCLLLQHSMHPDGIYYFFTSCIQLRPFNIPISLTMTCNKSDGG